MCKFDNVYSGIVWASLVASTVKKLPAVRETRIPSLGPEIPWRRPWQPTPVFLPGESPRTEEPRGLQSTGLQSQTWLSDWAHSNSLVCPVGSVVRSPPASAGDTGPMLGSRCSPRGGNGNPLQYSCLESPTERGAWQATVHGVARVRHDLATKPPPCSDWRSDQDSVWVTAKTAKLASMRKLSGVARGQLSRGVCHLTALWWLCSGPPLLYRSDKRRDGHGGDECWLSSGSTFADA